MSSLSIFKRERESKGICIDIRTSTLLTSGLNVLRIERCNILEDSEAEVTFNAEEQASEWLVMHAFEILTLKLKVK